MKHWMLFFSFLMSVKLSLACGGWYPFGEDVRYSLFNPALFDDGGMSEFYYSADYLSDMYRHAPESDRNVDDWQRLVGEEVSRQDVFEALYRLSAREIVDPQDSNAFVQKMFALGKKDELQYLAFAKKYSYLNNQYSDPWERDAADMSKQRGKAIGDAMRKVSNEKDEVLKRRYAFIALRLAFYHEATYLVNDIYHDYFNGINELTIDRWAKYYQLHTNRMDARRNFDVAQLFAETPSKRHGLFVLFDRKISIEDVLYYAKTNEEKANVWVMYTYREKGRQMDKITKIMELDPKNPVLPFLLVREVNKLEDWVLSPTYTAFAPVMREGISVWGDNDQSIVKEAVNEDRAYATSFWSWLKGVESNLDKDLYASLTTVIAFVCDQPSAALNTLKVAKFDRQDLIDWKERMLVLLDVASNESRRLESLDLSLFLDNEFDDKERFLFTMGRMFEFRGKLGEAALLYGALNQRNEGWEWFVWAEPAGYTTYNISFYTDYFDYFDANYKAKDVEGILGYAMRWMKKDVRLKRLAQNIARDKRKLLDLIGTKYLREDQLARAISIWKQVPEKYWSSDEVYYDHYLASNPFYMNFYSEHSKTPGDTIKYTKPEIAEELYRLIQLAEQQSGNEKAKTQFTIASCYFNMTTHGNSWMMRRSWWSANTYNTIFIDSDEFNKCLKAKEYFEKAYLSADREQFKALCLRMAGRCESYRLYFDHEYDYDMDYDQYGGYREYMFQKNEYYKQLKNEFPQWRDELVTNCHSFDRFYRSV